MDDKQLEEIKLLGAAQYTPEEVAKILFLDDEQAFVDATEDKSDPIYRAYWSGYYETHYKVRKSVFDLAGKGSGPAQAEARRIIAESETKRLYEQ